MRNVDKHQNCNAAIQKASLVKEHIAQTENDAGYG